METTASKIIRLPVVVVTGLVALSAYVGTVALQLVGRRVGQISPGSGEA
jgi:hypothetical protein